MHFAHSKWPSFLAVCLAVSVVSQGLFTWRYQLILALVFFPAFIWFLLSAPKEGDHKFQPLDYLVLGLTFLYLISFFWAANQRNALQEGIKYLLCVSVYWIASRSMVTPRQRFWFLQALAGISTLIAVSSIVVASGIVPYSRPIYVDRLAGVLQYPNALAASLLLGIGVTWGLRVAADGFRDRTLWGLALGAQVIVFFFTYSRIAWLALAALCGLFWLLNAGRRWTAVTSMIIAAVPVVPLMVPVEAAMKGVDTNIVLFGWFLVGLLIVAALETLAEFARKSKVVMVSAAVLGIGAIATAGVIVLPKTSLLLQRLTTISVGDANALSRFVTYADAVQGWLDVNPVLGLGGGAWKSVSMVYRSLSLVSKTVHSAIFETLIEVGVQGVVLLLAIWVMGLWAAWKAKASLEDGRLKRAWIGAIVGLTALLGHASLDFDFSYPAMVLLVFATIGLFRSTTMPVPTKGAGAKAKRAGFQLRHVAVAGLAVATVGVIPLTAAAFAQAKAVAAFGADNMQTAHDSFRTALRFDPLNDGLHSTYGDLLVQIGAQTGDKATLAEGGRLLERATELDANNARYHQMMAKYHYATNQPDKAFQDLERAAQLDPQDLATHKSALRAGLSLLENRLSNGKPAEAKTYLKQIGTIFARVDEARAKQPKGEAAAVYRWPEADYELDLHRAQYDAYLGKLRDAATALQGVYGHTQGDVQLEALQWHTAVRLAAGEIQSAGDVAEVRALDPAQANRVTVVQQLLALAEAIR